MDIHSLPRQAGFTLIELLVTLSIAAIVTTTVIPAMQEMVSRNTQTSEINTFVAHLQYSRSEAVKRGVRVVMCRSADGLTCGRNDGWHQGWITFADNNANREFDDDEDLLGVEMGQENNIIITSGQRRRVVYQATGSSPGTNATYTFCDNRYPDNAKAVILSNSGRPRLSDTKPNGRPLECG